MMMMMMTMMIMILVVVMVMVDGDGDDDDDDDDDDNDSDSGDGDGDSYYYYCDNSQFLRNMDRPLHSIPSFKQRRHFSRLEAGVRRVTCEKQKLLNYIYSAIYFFNKELMLQQSICSSLPIVKTSHSTIPYDHLLKERMGANCFSAVVILFSYKFGHQSSYLHRNSRII